jgi:methyltransferase (TIGR00027 family)
MTAGEASRTAEHMALFRALETARPAASRLFADPFATLFLRPGFRLVVRLSRPPLLRALVPRILDRVVPGARSSAVARTRLIDDLLLAALPETDQVVILGAGYDCRAYRIPALARRAVFEVDHPDTLARKQRRLAGTHVEHVRFVGTDFDRRSAADALATTDYDSTRRTFFIWEGVTNYLTAAAVDATFRWLGAVAPGSTVAFTYVHAAVLNAPQSLCGAERLLRDLARLGEPWTFGLDPAETPAYLRARGLTLVEDLGADAYRERYLAGRPDGRRGYAFYRVALATVADGPAAG